MMAGVADLPVSASIEAVFAVKIGCAVIQGAPGIGMA